MRRMISAVVIGLVAMAALFCAGCGGGKESSDEDAANFISWMTGFKLDVVIEPDTNAGRVDFTPKRKGNFYRTETVKLTATPNKGYKFRSWRHLDRSDDSRNTYEISMRGDNTVTAVFARCPTYTMAFNANDAAPKTLDTALTTALDRYFTELVDTVYMDSLSAAGVNHIFAVDSGNYVRLLKISHKEGELVRFKYWTLSPDDTGKKYKADTVYQVDRDSVTFYAQWNPVHTIKFDANGGTGTVPNPQTAILDSAIRLPSGVSRQGYIFNGWGEDPQGSDITYTAGNAYMVKGDATLYAQWAINSNNPNPVVVAEMAAYVNDNMVEIEAFTMDEIPYSAFKIGKYEVTQKLWRDVMGTNPSHFKGDSLPVENVSRDDIDDFLLKLNGIVSGKNYRLPSEAEWEWAARGGKDSKNYFYSGGNGVDTVAWYEGNSEGKTHIVGKKAKNELGIYDMSGNVWEWVAARDYSDPGYPQMLLGVTRGGGYGDRDVNCAFTRRQLPGVDYRDNDVGFRLISNP